MTTKTYQVRDAGGQVLTFQGVDIGGGTILMQSVSSDSTGTPYDANSPLPLYVPNFAPVLQSNQLTLPNSALTYASGQLMADNAAAGSVTPFSFANAVRAAGGVGRIERVRIIKSGPGIVNALFRVHFYNAAPSALANGDGGNWLTSKANYIGSADVTLDEVFTDGAQGVGLPRTFTPITYQIAVGTTLYALLEARGAYARATGGSGEQFQLQAENYRF